MAVSYTHLDVYKRQSLYKDIVLRSELKDFENKKQAVKEEALCLPVAALLINSLASKIVDAIQGIQVVSMLSLIHI